ncbi:hypothetical protein AB9_023 [Acinetobacter phage vB_AbaM_B9]|nr:hypothetical protein AB9_023 [Acinetobacter phage vB_AbaM_B9]
MKIVTDDQKGLGQEKGAFAYVNIDEYGEIDCGIRLVVDETDDFKPHYLIEHDLIGEYKDDIIFNFTSRNPLDEESEHLVGILTKEEVGEMIKSLQYIYGKME